jgi:mannose-1-phosphate guanylyltransferase
MQNKNRYIVILAGGGGTRLWPKSRKNTPKQLLKLLNNKTLLQETFERVEELVPEENIFVVTSGDFKNEIKKQLPNITEKNILVEPVPAGTSSAVGLAVVHIAARAPDAIISTLASDAYIKETQKFLSVLQTCQEVAGKGNYIVTMGIQPTFAHTGLGYIHSGREVMKFGKKAAFEVLDFTEKPDRPTAQAYVASGEYFWNANINSYSARTIFESFKEFTPKLSDALEKIAAVLGTKKEAEVTGRLWRELDNDPIDTAILEKAKNVLIVPADFIWHDIGDWGVLYELLTSSKTANVVLGENLELIDINTKSSLVYGNERLIATVGIENLVIIDTPDALLVAKKDKSQDVKKIVEELKRKSLEKYL